MRKKLSPALVVAILFSITVAIFCVMFFTQSEMMKRVYGCELRKDIFYINDLTETVLDELEAEGVDGADLIYYAGELSRCDLGARIHEGYLQLWVKPLQHFGTTAVCLPRVICRPMPKPSSPIPQLTLSGSCAVRRSI